LADLSVEGWAGGGVETVGGVAEGGGLAHYTHRWSPGVSRWTQLPWLAHIHAHAVTAPPWDDQASG